MAAPPFPELSLKTSNAASALQLAPDPQLHCQAMEAHSNEDTAPSDPLPHLLAYINHLFSSSRHIFNAQVLEKATAHVQTSVSETAAAAINKNIYQIEKLATALPMVPANATRDIARNCITDEERWKRQKGE